VRTLVIAPHPDDEVLGCGGTLLRKKAEGGELGWLIVTGMSESDGWSPERIQMRDSEIARVPSVIGFDRVYNLGLPTTKLDTIAMSDIVRRFSETFVDFEPDEVLVPHHGDVHSDYEVVFDAAAACVKWFRYPFVTRVLAYETLSETDLALDPSRVFRPTVFVDISDFLEKKLEVMKVYESEMGGFPFPRSAEALRALATVRGAAAGFSATEAFELLRERVGSP
jgi:LmbE family N-acetylglucosaminyl deacetylase